MSSLTGEFAGHFLFLFRVVTCLHSHREMHTLTANFRNDAVMYGRVIISEVALPVAQKTIKPLDSSGILGGDKVLYSPFFFVAFCLSYQIVVSTVWDRFISSEFLFFVF